MERLVCWPWVRSLLVLAFVLGMPLHSFASKAVGKVVAVTGRVLIYPSGATQGRLAAPGTLLYQGDTLQAEEHSQAKLLMVDDSILTISESTHLNLEEYHFEREVKTRRSLMNLFKGKMRLLVSKLLAFRSEYRVQTPTAVMGVRGTSPVIWTDPDPDCTKETFPPECGCIPFTWLLTLDGEMGMRNVLPEVEGEVMVRGGWISLVCEREPPTVPRLATAEEIERALEGTVVPLIPGETFLIDEVFFAPEQAGTIKQEVEQAILESPVGLAPAELPGTTDPDMTQKVVSTEPLPEVVSPPLPEPIEEPVLPPLPPPPPPPGD